MVPDKIYIVKHEWFHGAEVNKAFTDENLANEFCKRIGGCSPEVMEVSYRIPETFCFNVIFEGFSKPYVRFWDMEPKDAILISNPTHVSVNIMARDISEVAELARKKAIEFIRNTDSLFMNRTYFFDGEIYHKDKEYDRLIPLIPDMRQQLLATLEGNRLEAHKASICTVLNFWASPKSEDGLYHFNIKKTEFEEELGECVAEEDYIPELPAITMSATTSEITVPLSEKELFLELAKETGFQIVSEDETSLVLKRNV